MLNINKAIYSCSYFINTTQTKSVYYLYKNFKSHFYIDFITKKEKLLGISRTDIKNPNDLKYEIKRINKGMLRYV